MLDNEFIMKTYGRLPVTFIKGSGAYLFDVNGKKYLDFLSGLGVTGLGHSNQGIAEAVCKQMNQLVHVSNLYSTEPQQILAKKLSEISLGGKVFFANSGAEANEAAIKLARKHGKLKLNGAYEIITALNSFHGRTLATLAATAQPEKQKSFLPMPEGFKYVDFNDISAIKKALNKNTCAIMLETIQGEGGINVADVEYLAEVKEICTQNGVLFIIDEVQTGIGRTGEWFSIKHFGIKPNAITTAKGLANGLPIGALIADENTSTIFEPGDHASTFGGGPVICAAAIKTLEQIESNAILENVKKTGTYFDKKLNGLIEKKLAKSIKGVGLMKALTLAKENAADIMQNCMENGLLLNNVKSDTLRFLPPLIIGEQEVDLAVDIIETSIKKEGL